MTNRFPSLEPNPRFNVLRFRVTYADTDRMGLAYHGIYARWLEQGRVEWLRANGVSYAELEKQGTLLPVTRMEEFFLSPLPYDDEFQLCTAILSFRRASITFGSSFFSSQGKRCCNARVELACVDLSGRPKRIPAALSAIAHQMRIEDEF